MGCNLSVLNGDITLDCADIPVGGIIKAYLVKLADITSTTEVDGEVTAIALSNVVDMEFNPKDGFSSFTDTKTVDETGVVTAIPTLLLEFPKMTLEKRNSIELLTSNGIEIVAFIETSAGERHALGMDFGLRGSEGNGQSGTGRTEKNKYDVKLEGEETNLSRYISDAAWSSIVAAVI